MEQGVGRIEFLSYHVFLVYSPEENLAALLLTCRSKAEE